MNQNFIALTIALAAIIIISSQWEAIKKILFPTEQNIKYVKVCPECSSTNISIPPQGLDIAMTRRDHCKDCNNFGNFQEVKIDKVKSYRKNLKLKKKR